MKHTLLTTSTDGYSYEDYLEYCEMNDMEPGDKDSMEFFEWLEDAARMDYEADLYHIMHCKSYNVPVVVCGTVGLWNGRHEIVPTRVESVYEAIQRCYGRSIDDLEAVWEDGVITVYAYHHDGTNVFEINALNKKGIAKKNAEYKPHDLKKLPYFYMRYDGRNYQ